MKNIIERANFAALVLLTTVWSSCASPTRITQVPETIDLSGRVFLRSPVPTPRAWPLEEEMQIFSDEPVFTDEAILVSEDLGLANCVITVLPRSKNFEADPIEGALYEKVGLRYEPRVMVVTPGSDVVFRNRNSLCNGFMARGYFAQFNRTITAGNEFTHHFERAGVVPIQCDLREYMQGAIIVANTNWFAVTDSEGRWKIDDLPNGDYEVRVWHERMNSRKGEVITSWTGPWNMVDMELEKFVDLPE